MLARILPSSSAASAHPPRPVRGSSRDGQLHWRTRWRRLAAILTVVLPAVSLCPGRDARGEATGMYRVDDFTHAALHEEGERSKEAQRCFRVIEDEDAEQGRALAVRLSKPLIRAGDFAVLRTPAQTDPLPTGTYRATIRIKVQGMLSSLGSAVAVTAGDQTREIWMNEFDEEDAYREFSVDFESRPGDIVTRRNAFGWGAPGGPGSLVQPEELPEIEKALARNSAPWEEQFAWWMAERVAVPKLRAKRERVPEFAAAIAAALTNAGPEGLVFDETAGTPLTEEVVKAINEHGALRPNGSVRVHFPQDTTGQAVGGSRGPATPHATLRTLTVDWVRVERLPEPEHLVLRQVRCRYPWRRPGEEQVVSLWLHNRSGAARGNVLRVLVRSGLTHEETLWEEPVELQQGQYTHLLKTWKIPSDQRPWGQAIVAQVLRDGEVVSEERTWFALHRFSNAVMIHDPPNTRRFLHPYAEHAPRTRNHRELFGATCTIYDSAGVVPDPDIFFEPYIVGNGSYFMSIPTLTSITRGLADSGVAPFYYLESNGSAERALEIFWDHPDWVPHAPANMDSFLINRKKTGREWLDWYFQDPAKRQREPPSVARAGGAYSGQLVALNGIVKENVDRVIQGSLKLCEHTAFMGIRWDGIPFIARNAKSLGGSWGKTPEELDAITCANIRRFREELRAKHPDFELRANGGIAELQERLADPYDYEHAWEVMQQHPEHIALVEGHGSVMEEMWMSYAGFGNYKNNCLNYLRTCHYENSAFKRAGGHNGHMLWFYDAKTQYTPDEIYQQLFTFLGGAHLDGAFGPIVESIYDLSVYATRFSEFFWDPELRAIPRMMDKVMLDAEADVWVSEAGFQKVNERGNMLYVIPVINPPVTELWLQNRFGLLPEAIREPIGLTVLKPEGYGGAVAAVYLLENDPHPAVKPLEFEDDGGEVYFELPELLVFEVAVVEFAPDAAAAARAAAATRKDA